MPSRSAGSRGAAAAAAARAGDAAPPAPPAAPAAGADDEAAAGAAGSLCRRLLQLSDAPVPGDAASTVLASDDCAAPLPNAPRKFAPAASTSRPLLALAADAPPRAGAAAAALARRNRSKVCILACATRDQGQRRRMLGCGTRRAPNWWWVGIIMGNRFCHESRVERDDDGPARPGRRSRTRSDLASHSVTDTHPRAVVARPAFSGCVIA
jgi:hypothetical protein